APTNKRHVVAAARAVLPQDLIAGLESLADDLQDQPRFAERSAEWSRTAAQHLASASPTSGSSSFPWLHPRVEYVLRPQQLDADTRGAGKAKKPAERPTGDQRGDSTFAAEELAREPSSAADEYRVFTTAHDRVVAATDLVERQELAELRARLESELSSLRPGIARLAKGLPRVPMAKQQPGLRFSLVAGRPHRTRR